MRDQAAPLEVVEDVQVRAHRGAFLRCRGSRQACLIDAAAATGSAGQSHSPNASGSRVTRYVAQFILRDTAVGVAGDPQQLALPRARRRCGTGRGSTCSKREDGLCSGSARRAGLEPSLRAPRT